MSLSSTSARLRTLEKQGKLEQLLAPVDDGLPWADIVWMLHLPALLGLLIHGARMALAASDSHVSPPTSEIVWLVVLALVTIALRVVGPRLRTEQQRLRTRVRRHGVVVPAAIVQANHAFHEADNDQWLPASLLVSFDPEVVNQSERLGRAAKRLSGLKRADRSTLSEAHAQLAWTLYHEMGPCTSLPVPPDLTEGLRDCILATVMLPPKPLREGPLCTCLAVPGSMSPAAIAVIPAAAAT